MKQPSWELAGLALSIFGSAFAGLLAFIIAFVINLAIGIAVTWAIIAGTSSDPIIATLLGLGVFVVIIGLGTLLSFKLGVTIVAANVLRTSPIAAEIINFLFKGLVPDADEPHGERGHLGTKAAERVPLRTCEQMLTARVDELLKSKPESQSSGIKGWAASQVRSLLLKLVAKITLKEMRREDSAHQGVDLHKVREHLINHATVEIPAAMEQKARIAGIIALTVPSIVSGLGALLIYWILVRYLGA
jgi:hypothetical protein